jgi:hypothetical protein
LDLMITFLVARPFIELPKVSKIHRTTVINSKKMNIKQIVNNVGSKKNVVEIE